MQWIDNVMYSHSDRLLLIVFLFGVYSSVVIHNIHDLQKQKQMTFIN